MEGKKSLVHLIVVSRQDELSVKLVLIKTTYEYSMFSHRVHYNVVEAPVKISLPARWPTSIARTY